MKVHKMYILVLGVVLLPLASSLPAKASSEDNQAILAGLQSLRDAVHRSTERLSRKATAQGILAQDLGTTMPRDLAQGLLRELNILEALQKTNVDAFPPIIDAEQALAEGRPLKNREGLITTIQEMITTVQDVHHLLDKAVTTESEGRHAFKQRLNSVLDALIVVNPKKAATYMQIKTALDPDLLDLEFGSVQRPILAGLVIILNQLR